MGDFGAKIGDAVSIYFANGDVIRGIVKYIPCATGESWIIWDDERRIVHVQEFETITVMFRRAGLDPEVDK